MEAQLKQEKEQEAAQEPVVSASWGLPREIKSQKGSVFEWWGLGQHGYHQSSTESSWQWQRWHNWFNSQSSHKQDQMKALEQKAVDVQSEMQRLEVCGRERSCLDEGFVLVWIGLDWFVCLFVCLFVYSLTFAVWFWWCSAGCDFGFGFLGSFARIISKYLWRLKCGHGSKGITQWTPEQKYLAKSCQ